MNLQNYKKSSIKYHVRRYIESNVEWFKSKSVVDIPCGSGATTEILQRVGANVTPCDLFPEYFALSDIKCIQADVTQGLPFRPSEADALICQEGIEHFSDQLSALKEFNRVLNKDGLLLITTPNASNFASKWANLTFESENKRLMPPNECDDIWMDAGQSSKQVYYGHLFLLGVQKLRTLATLAGFDLISVERTTRSSSSYLLSPFLYPVVYLSSLRTYLRNLKRSKNVAQRQLYKQQFRLNTSPKVLLNKHLFLVFKKRCDLENISFDVEGKRVEFDGLT